MKVRSGFVSNSSTSSFICEVCGRKETEWDSVDIADLGFVRCENEHLFCDEEMVDDYTDAEKEEMESKDRYGVPSKCCPICTMSVFSDDDLVRYLTILTKIPEQEAFDYVKSLNKRRRVIRSGEYAMYACMKSGINRDTLLQEAKEKFQTYEGFKEYLGKAEDEMEA